MLTKHTHDIIETNFRKNFTRNFPPCAGFPRQTFLAPAYYSRPKFLKLTPNAGIGKFLIFINKYPHRTHKQIITELNCSSDYSELFQYMTSAEIITSSNKPGYTITELGKSVLKQFNLI